MLTASPVHQLVPRLGANNSVRREFITGLKYLDRALSLSAEITICLSALCAVAIQDGLQSLHGRALAPFGKLRQFHGNGLDGLHRSRGVVFYKRPVRAAKSVFLLLGYYPRFCVNTEFGAK